MYVPLDLTIVHIVHITQSVPWTWAARGAEALLSFLSEMVSLTSVLLLMQPHS